MKHIRIGFYLGILFLTLLSACQMGAATPTPVVPAPVTCNQTGCPYPAVCDKNTGVCTIYQTPQAPLTKANNPGPAAGAIVANNPGSLLPQACKPPAPSISNINSFCANLPAGVGGATWQQTPPDGDPSLAMDAAFIDNFTKNPDCTWDQSKVACSGAQSAKVSYELCTSCGAPNWVDPSAYASTFGPYVCMTGSVAMNGGCVPPTTTPGTYLNLGVCPTGSHYDNALQNCVDDTTNQLASPCPPAYPYFIPVMRLCVAKAYPIVYDCQTFTVPLGACLVPVKKVCLPPAGGCGFGFNGAKQHWDPTTCSCK